MSSITGGVLQGVVLLLAPIHIVLAARWGIARASRLVIPSILVILLAGASGCLEVAVTQVTGHSHGLLLKALLIVNMVCGVVLDAYIIYSTFSMAHASTRMKICMFVTFILFLGAAALQILAGVYIYLGRMHKELLIANTSVQIAFDVLCLVSLTVILSNKVGASGMKKTAAKTFAMYIPTFCLLLMVFAENVLGLFIDILDVNTENVNFTESATALPLTSLWLFPVNEAEGIAISILVLLSVISVFFDSAMAYFISPIDVKKEGVLTPASTQKEQAALGPSLSYLRQGQGSDAEIPYFGTYIPNVHARYSQGSASHSWRSQSNAETYMRQSAILHAESIASEITCVVERAANAYASPYGGFAETPIHEKTCYPDEEKSERTAKAIPSWERTVSRKHALHVTNESSEDDMSPSPSTDSEESAGLNYMLSSEQELDERRHGEMDSSIETHQIVELGLGSPWKGPPGMHFPRDEFLVDGFDSDDEKFSNVIVSPLTYQFPRMDSGEGDAKEEIPDSTSTQRFSWMDFPWVEHSRSIGNMANQEPVNRKLTYGDEETAEYVINVDPAEDYDTFPERLSTASTVLTMAHAK